MLKSYFYHICVWLLSIIFWLQFNLSSSQASDSIAIYGSDGLKLVKSEEISLDSEELFIGPGEVLVKYQFFNHSDQEIEALISFPIVNTLQELDEHSEDQGYPLTAENLQFRTTVNGVPVSSDVLQRPEINGLDVSARLSELEWPAQWSFGSNFLDELNEFTIAEKEKFIKEGLLRKSEKYESVGVVPNWTHAIHMTREAIFPAHKTVEVIHRFNLPSASIDYFTKRSQDALATQYCIGTHFSESMEKGGYKSIASPYSLRYLLKSSAHWRGPIKSFKLVIDKGLSDAIMSSCIKNLRKISPTQFEVQKTNYEPDEDIDILLVSWYNSD